MRDRRMRFQYGQRSLTPNLRKVSPFIFCVPALMVVFFPMVTTATALRSLAAQSQLGPGDSHQRSRAAAGTKVTDSSSGIAGAELYPIDAYMFPPLTNLEWRASADAEPMQPDDPVLGLVIHDHSWAIPWWLMKRPHVANLTLEGQPVLIALCEICSSGIALDPVVDGRRLTFHLAGRYNGAILLADYETNSYWTPFTGEALEGPLKATELKQIELVQCRWSEWLQLHPKSLVACGPEQSPGHGFRRPGDPPNPALLGLLVKRLDQRLPVSELVLGVRIARQSRVYPLSTLDAVPDPDKKTVVVNDTVGKDKIVVLHQRGSWLTTAFSRRLGRKTLQFASDKGGRFVDSTYHSHWNYEGEAMDGPVAGQKLSHVDSRVEDWYIWAAYYPTTSIFGSRPVKND